MEEAAHKQLMRDLRRNASRGGVVEKATVASLASMRIMVETVE